MLCDDLCEQGVPFSGMNISNTIPKIRAAQKFVLSPSFASVADALSEDYTGLVKVFPWCRLPYAQTWIEVAHADRPHFISAELQAPGFQIRPKRVGFLLSATRPDLSAWKAHLFWSSNENEMGCSCAALAMLFDMTEELCHETVFDEELRQQSIQELMDRQIVTNVKVHPGWTGASADVKAAMVNHTLPDLPDYGVPMLPGLSAEQEREMYDTFADLARSDWAGETAYVMAVIGLLNARNAVETETVDHSRMNRARIRRGKPPFLEHKVLKIAQRQVTRVPGDRDHGPHAAMRLHFVRGHFKSRRSGVYFWNPHARGDAAKGRVEKDYQL